MINFRLIRHLWLFLAVAEEEHFGKAAQRLGMSQPPLTEQIQVLEQALKVRLFDRSRRGAQLTAAGAAILPAVRKFAQQLEQLEFAVREAVAGQTGVLTIGAVTSAMVDHLPDIISRFKQAHPQLTISVLEIDSAQAVPALKAFDIDLAFARLEGELGAGMNSLPLTQDRLVVALPRTHPMSGLSRIRLSTLADEGFVMFSRSISPAYFDGLVSTCRANGFSPRILHEVRSVTSQIALVGCGQGVALVPSAYKKMASDNVVFRPLKEPVNVVTMTVAWCGSRENPLVEELIEMIKSRYSNPRAAKLS